MKTTTLTAAIAALLILPATAQARARHDHGAVYQQRAVYYTAGRHFAARRTSPKAGQDYASVWGYQASATDAFAWSMQAGASSGGYGARPRAWCGWQMRQLVGSDPGPQYNLARNWAHWGQAGAPGVGAVVVWAHHVGKIVGQENGQWIVQSGNDGNRMRTRALPISNAIAVRWG
jgi:hypothetical protein